MSNYTKTVNFAAKDALTTGDANKIVKGTEIDTEFNNIATAVATKADTSSPTLVTPNIGVATGTSLTATTLNASSACNLGTTSQVSPYGAKAFILFDPATEQGITLKAASGTFTGNPVTFINVSNAVSGSIAQTTSTIAYLTTSDYRTKNSIAPMTGALSKVSLLKPCTYKWNADGSDSQGFIAHELQAVVKECVVGEKDATNADGSPKLQGVDTSFLVATLTAAIQELKALFDAQAARITALETP